MSGFFHPTSLPRYKAFERAGNNKVIALYVGLFSSNICQLINELAEYAGRTHDVIALYVGLFSSNNKKEDYEEIEKIVIALYVGLFSSNAASSRHRKL